MTDSNSNYSDLPLGWKRVKLPYFCHLIMGQSPPSSTYNTQKIGLPFYQGKSEFGHIYPNPQKYCSKPNKIAEKGDILLSVRAPVGATNVCLEKSCIGRGLAALRPLENSSTKFIFFLFRYLEPILAKAGTGTTFKAINKDFLCQLELNVPPLPEQHRIVEKIEELFSELDDGVASLKKALEQLKTYRQAVLKWAFEGKLTEKWRNTHQDSLEDADTLLEQIKAERKRHYQQQLEDWKQALKEWENNGKETKKPTKPQQPKDLPPLTKEELSNLPSLPNGWMWVKIGNIYLVGTGVTPLKKKQEYYTNGSISWVTSGALNDNFVRQASDYITELALSETNLKLYPKHTLLVALYGEGKTRGKCSELLIEATTNQAIAAIVQNGLAELTRPFLKWFLQKNYEAIRLKSSGGVQPNLNLSIIENTIFPFPSLQEQTQIVQEIESRLSVCDQLEATLTENLDKAEALRQSILKRAFEGKLVL
ncbi:restriction endonuclease subunit S [Microcystis aeruginosa]|uniref:Restriction modification system DNA specificity domain protein n=1 Tax=Microcystis aeruginosa NIES-3787 TaxID=2517782 RepID=A0A6H9GFJ0_MICAE|nr:restriction endonuclease subunit S [Microcystis aeruginosa]GCL45276.1 restriction modification system DNA specificity domain protein [Microcystis aeruginosa NIES-3787]